MSKVLLLALVLMLTANCATRADSQPNKAASLHQNSQPQTSNNTSTPANDSNDVADESEKNEEVPTEFRGIDFKNFSYPISWDSERGWKTKIIQLKDGRREYYEDKIFGNAWFDFKDVDYFDVTGDGKKEAIIRLSQVLCGASCDGGSNLFYVYSIRHGKLNLLWRVGSSSLGYGCGLKSFALDGRKITLEVFKNCYLENRSLEPNKFKVSLTSPYFKFDSRNTFTRFLFEFNGRTFALKKREVFPYPKQDVKNYEPTIRLGNE